MSRRFRDLLLRRLDVALTIEPELTELPSDMYFARELVLSHADAFVKSRPIALKVKVKQ